jgi:3-methyladenine DNA glycosylase Tag
MTLSFHKVDFDAQEVIDLAQDCDSLDEFTERFTDKAEQRSRGETET